MSSSITEKYLKIIDEIQTIKPEAKLTILLQYTPSTQNDTYFIYFLMSAIAQERTLAKNSSAYLPLALHYVAGLADHQSQHAVELLHDIMANVYQPMLSALIESNVSVIDLASTFNPSDENLYVSQIEPSEKGANLIANLISDAISRPGDESRLFSKPSQKINGATLITSLEEVAAHWRPGHVYLDESDARKAFVDAYNDSSQQENGLFKLFKSNKDNLIGYKSLTTLVEESINGQASEKSTKIMKRLNFLDHKAQFTEKKCSIRTH